MSKGKTNIQGDCLRLEGLIDECLKFERLRQMSERSIQELTRYLRDLAGYVADHGLKCLEDVCPAVLQRFVQDRGQGCAPATVKAIVWSLRKFGAFLAVNGYLPTDPAVKLHHPKISQRANLPEFLDEHELRSLLNTAAKTGRMQDFVLVSLFASTGIRVHEAAELTFGNVDQDAFCISHRVKGGWRKQTALNQSMAELLQRWRCHRQPLTDEAALFLNSRGNRAQVPWMQRRIKDLGRDAQLDRPLTPKMLRHTFATHAADRNGRLLTKSLMGHSDLSRTTVYIHLCPTMFRNLMQKNPYPQLIKQGKRHHG